MSQVFGNKLKTLRRCFMNNSLPTRFPRGVERLMVEIIANRTSFVSADRQAQVILWPHTLCNVAQNLGHIFGYKFIETIGVECRAFPKDGSILYSQIEYEFHSLKTGKRFVLRQGDELIIYPPSWLNTWH